MSTRATAPTVHLVASPGGHLDLLKHLSGAFAALRRVWLTRAGEPAAGLARAGEHVLTLPDWSRNPGRVAAALARAGRLVGRERPALVVTTGAGMAVPFCLASRARGADLVFVETMARITDGSLAGRLLAPFASRVLVQWPELLAVYPKARLCRPALIEEVEPGARPPDGGGTFVAVGTHAQPFDRLLAMVDRAAARGALPKPVYAQTGTSGYRSSSFDGKPYLAPDDVDERLRGSRFVVSHAGAGIVSAANRAGRRPLVLARRRDHQEHVDDHQLQLVEKLGDLGLVVPLNDDIDPDALERASAPLPGGAIDRELPALEEELRRAVEDHLEARA